MSRSALFVRAPRTARPFSTAPDAPLNLASAVIPPQGAHSGLAPVVMLHGIMASSNTYASIMRRADFAPGRTKIGIDLRNHGQSPHTPGMSYAAMANDVSSTLRDLNVSQAVLVGHSMGGKVAMHMALSQADLVNALIVVDIAPMTYERRADPTGSSPTTILRALQNIDVGACKSRGEIDAALEQGGVKLSSVRQFVMTNLTRNDDRSFAWRMNVNHLAEGLPEILGFPDVSRQVYRGRTCVIRGGKSTYVPFGAMRKVTELFPRTKLVTLSDAGHWLQAEQPDAFVNSVNKFLADDD